MKQEPSEVIFQFFECENPNCGLRFANDLSTSQFGRCPRCGSRMNLSGEPFSNFQRTPCKTLPPGYTLHLILDNLRSAQNTGSIFRTANGAGVTRIYCCGTTPTPDHRGVRKASLGAEEFTAWNYHPNCPALVRSLKETGCHICAIESTASSKPIFSARIDLQKQAELALIVGNEICGIDPQVLEMADQVLHIPMSGSKTSINVAVAAGIALYSLIDQLNTLQAEE